MRVWAGALAAVLTGLGPTAARAESDWFARLYTPAGVEVRSDSRLFTLYALLNRAGYDGGTLRRQHPVPAYSYPPARARVRQALEAADPSVLTRAEAFFNRHPVPLERYVAWTLHPGGAREPEVAELRGLLELAEARWPLAELRGETFGASRAALRAWLPGLDQALGRARQLLRVADGGAPVHLVVEVLEVEGVVRSARVGEQVVVVAGPPRTPEVEAVVREYTRQVLGSRLREEAWVRWTAGPAVWQQARARGAEEETPGAYAVGLLARALALRAVEAPVSDYEAASRQGYTGLQELARSFDDSRPVEAWALEALVRAGLGRPLQ
jgi:hypothetical protein